MSIRLAVLIIFFTTAGLTSCGPKIIYEETVSIDAPWKYENEVKFDFSIVDTTSYYKIDLDVDYQDELFKYQNVYIQIKTIFPGGELTQDILSLDLRDKSGATQGNCKGGECSVSFLLEEGIRFKFQGDYSLVISQYSRNDELLGIDNLSLSIIELEEHG